METNNALSVSLIQAPLVWENPSANRDYFGKIILSQPEKNQLFVLPEMFTTGFSMNAEQLAEAMEGETMQWMSKLAKQTNSAIMGSVIIKDHWKFYNRLVFATSEEVQFYDKRHLFSLAGEDKIFTAGIEKIIIEYKGFRICPMICYDLRFPVFSRNDANYDLLVYVANWPKQRIAAWDALLKARAIENMSYVIGVNRIGKDGLGANYPGHSQLIDYMGEIVSDAGENESVITKKIEKKPMLEAREKFGFLNDRDLFTVNGISAPNPS